MGAGSRNPQAYLLSAQVRMDGSSVGGTTDFPGAGGLNIATALGEIRQALALDPGSIEAYEAMGRAFFLSPAITADDVAELTRGLGPGRDRVRHYRALLHERLENYAESLADLRAVIADPECPPGLRQASEQRIAMVTFLEQRRRVEAMVKDHQFTGARALLVAAKPENQAVAQDYDRVLTWVAENERVELFAKLRDEVETRVAEKNFKEARTALEVAERATTDAKLIAEIKRLRAWAEQNAALNFRR
jgi:hypothetical protein